MRGSTGTTGLAEELWIQGHSPFLRIVGTEGHYFFPSPARPRWLLGAPLRNIFGAEAPVSWTTGRVEPAYG